MKLIYLQIACVAAVAMLSSCANEYDYRSTDSVALMRANIESTNGTYELSSDARTQSSRSSASMRGLEGVTGMR